MRESKAKPGVIWEIEKDTNAQYQVGNPEPISISTHYTVVAEHPGGNRTIHGYLRTREQAEQRINDIEERWSNGLEEPNTDY